MNIRTSDSGSQAQYKGNTRNHGLQDPNVYVVFWALTALESEARSEVLRGSGSYCTRTGKLSESSPSYAPTGTVSRTIAVLSHTELPAKGKTPCVGCRLGVFRQMFWALFVPPKVSQLS